MDHNVTAVPKSKPMSSNVKFPNMASQLQTIYNAKSGKHISNTMASTIIKFTSTVHVANDDDSLLELSGEILSQVESPILEALQMQAVFLDCYAHRNVILENQRKLVNSKLDDVVNKLELNNISAQDDALNLIVSFVVLKSGIVCPTDSNMNEVAAAVNDIFPTDKIDQFQELKRDDKIMALNELSDIVAGILLFHKQCKIGSSSVDDLSTILNEALTQAEAQLTSEIAANEHRLNLIAQNKKSQSEEFINFKSPRIADELLFNFSQYHIFLHTLLTDVNHCLKQTNEQSELLKNSLSDIVDAQLYSNGHKLSSNNSLMMVANVWSSLQDEVIVLSHIVSLFFKLKFFTKTSSKMFKDNFQETLDQSADEDMQSDEIIKKIISEYASSLIIPKPEEQALDDVDSLCNVICNTKKHDMATQTNLSIFKKDNGSQTGLVRCQSTQTREDSWTNTTRHIQRISTIFAPLLP